MKRNQQKLTMCTKACYACAYRPIIHYTYIWYIISLLANNAVMLWCCWPRYKYDVRMHCVCSRLWSIFNKVPLSFTAMIIVFHDYLQLNRIRVSSCELSIFRSIGYCLFNAQFKWKTWNNENDDDDENSFQIE